MSEQPDAPQSPDQPARALLADERMQPAELRVVREYLSLTTRWIAEQRGVAERSVQRWEHGHAPIPDGVRRQVEQWEAGTAATVDLAVTRLLDAPEPAVATYRSDEHYREHERDAVWPALWHRAVVARVAERVPGLVILYRD